MFGVTHMDRCMEMARDGFLTNEIFLSVWMIVVPPSLPLGLRWTEQGFLGTEDEQ